jgi:hypothetical protein
MSQAVEYVRAIEMSLAAARMGCEFADEGIDLCKVVAKGDAHIDDLNRFLYDMMDKAGAAHAHALAMDKQFARVRSAIFQVRSIVYREHLNTESTPIRSQETYLLMSKG